MFLRIGERRNSKAGVQMGKEKRKILVEPEEPLLEDVFCYLDYDLLKESFQNDKFQRTLGSEKKT